jgi:hypothetical protein
MVTKQRRGVESVANAFATTIVVSISISFNSNLQQTNSINNNKKQQQQQQQSLT